MKVAYLLPSVRKHDGWRTHVIGFVNAIRTAVEPVLFVAPEDREAAAGLFPWCERVTLPAIQSANIRMGNLPKVLATVAAIGLGKFPQVDVVHSLEAYPTGLVGYLLASKLNRPHVLTAHGTYGVAAYAAPADRIAYNRVLKTASLLCPVSHGTADLIRKSFAKALAHVPVEPVLNGNDFFRRVPIEEVRKRTAGAHTPTVLSVGAVKPRKGQHVSLKAFARVKEQLADARYLIVGEPDSRRYQDELLQFIRRNGVRDVEFLGAVSDETLNRCYREASVFVLAPQQVGFQFEGFGLVYLEAGAYGLPVIGTRTGGVPDAIREGITGLLADPDDVEGLAAAMLRLLTDTDLARRMGMENRAWAETLTWERCASEHCKLYQAILDTANYPLRSARGCVTHS